MKGGPRRFPPWEQERISLLRDLIAKDLTSHQAGEILGVSRSAAVAQARRMGWHFGNGKGGRRPGSQAGKVKKPAPPPPPKPAPRRDGEIKDLAARGFSRNQIAAHLRMPYAEIERALAPQVRQ